MKLHLIQSPFSTHRTLTIACFYLIWFKNSFRLGSIYLHRRIIVKSFRPKSPHCKQQVLLPALSISSGRFWFDLVLITFRPMSFWPWTNSAGRSRTNMARVRIRPSFASSRLSAKFEIWNRFSENSVNFLLNFAWFHFIACSSQHCFRWKVLCADSSAALRTVVGCATRFDCCLISGIFYHSGIRQVLLINK